ncbi:NAD-dependent DNA ligase LigA [Aquirufa aurantiipilula]|uniref:NAD-dependent DNA ligase LigA n=1 Tax=Aquirufa aurantiipilula TaxID=2696561 RepID=UPI001CAA8146|nr:NAD-dependent DNA ligase LigA [Aquirufa aurantiipilula]MBZ1325494.1 NAD-dependent DNA ligase LigA [Aquirufa aurantiipilula]
MDVKMRMEELIHQINRYNEAYYQQHESLISDQEFDVLLAELQKLENENPLFALPDSPTQRVGGTITKQFKSVTHRFPMLSLGNTYNEQDLRDFDERVSKGLEGERYEYICELKFDGVALSFWYENGKLIKGVTRGDGTRGDDITNNVKTIKDLPLRLNSPIFPKEFELRGEGYMPLSSFETINEQKISRGEAPLANPRNAASGTFKMQDSAEVARRNMACYIYAMVGNENPFQTHEESIVALSNAKFPVSPTWKKCQTMDEVLTYIHEWQDKRHDLPLNTDGIVIKINDYAQQERLGFTAKSPRWAIAYKYPSEIAETEIESISYQVGRTGNVTPVANLKPVYLAGTVIKRASVHNANEMERLDLRENDTVFIEKGGEIIPKITSVNVAKRKFDSPKFQFPNECPACGTLLVRQEGEANHYCLNDKHCPPQIKGKIEHFIQRKALNIENLGVETIDLLVEKGIIHYLADLYDLQTSHFDGLEGFQSKSINNILQSIEKSKTIPFRQVLFGLGIRHVGATIAEKLVRQFHSMENLAQATLEELIAVPEIGERIARSLKEYLDDSDNIHQIERLRQAGVQLSEEIQEIVLEGEALVGKSFVISGVFKNFEREELKDKIIANGGKVVSSISAKLDYLVAGENMGPAKLEKANSLSIKIITEDEFLALLH